MKRHLRWIGTGLATIGTVVFIGHVVSTLRFETLRDYLTPGSGWAFAAALLLYATIVPTSALAWQRMLAAMGHRQGYRPLVSILLVTQAGKYLPGNVGQHLGRIALSVTRGIPMPLIVTSMAYEILLVLLADLLVAAVCAVLSPPGIDAVLGTQSMRGSVTIALVIGAGGLAALPLLCRYLPGIVAFVLRRGGTRDTAAIVPLGARQLLQTTGIYIVAMLLVGACLYVLARGMFPAHAADYALLTAAFTIAWAVGFVTPGAPAGIGIREALLLLMLAPSFGTAQASVLILALRVVTTLGDMLLLGVGLLIMPASRPRDDVTDAARVGESAQASPGDEGAL